MANELDLLKPPTDKQEIFLRVYVETGDSTRAAAEAGYANPDAQGRALRRNVNLVPLIRLETHRRLQEHVPAAINAIVDAMHDEKAPRSVRLDAAKTILDRSGYAAFTPKNNNLRDDRPLAELSLAELHDLARKLSEELANAAESCVDITPSIELDGQALEGDNAAEFRGNHAQVIDPLE